MTGRIRVLVNGKTHELRPGTTVLALLDSIGIRGGPHAVEVNHEVVPRSTHHERELRDSDTVEIVTFVGGG